MPRLPPSCLVAARRVPLAAVIPPGSGGDRLRDLLARGDPPPGLLPPAPGPGPEVLLASPFTFALMRDPVARIRALAARPGPHLPPGLQDAAMAETTRLTRLADWLETGGAAGPDWQSQCRFLARHGLSGLPVIARDRLAADLARLAGRAEAPPHDMPAEVPPDRGLPAALAARFRALHADDVACLAGARALWAARHAGGWQPLPPRPVAPSRAPRLLTTRRWPVWALPVPKAGCTFLRNLFYRLDHDRDHPEPRAIQADGCLCSARIGRDGHGGRGFMLVRDPVARFLSLYLDKVAGQGFPWLVRQLARDRRFVADPGADPVAHRGNLALLLDLVAREMQAGPETLNPHWRPQWVAARRGRRAGLRGLLLEQASAQIPRHLAGTVPGIAGHVAATAGRNASARPWGAAQGTTPLLTAALESRILSLYGPDRDLHAAIAAGWARDGAAPLI